MIKPITIYKKKKENSGDQNFVANNFSTSDEQSTRTKKTQVFKTRPMQKKALLTETNLPVGTSPGAAAVPIFAGMCSLLKNI